LHTSHEVERERERERQKQRERERGRRTQFTTFSATMFASVMRLFAFGADLIGREHTTPTQTRKTNAPEAEKPQEENNTGEIATSKPHNTHTHTHTHTHTQTHTLDMCILIHAPNSLYTMHNALDSKFASYTIVIPITVMVRNALLRTSIVSTWNAFVF